MKNFDFSFKFYTENPHKKEPLNSRALIKRSPYMYMLKGKVFTA